MIKHNLIYLFTIILLSSFTIFNTSSWGSVILLVLTMLTAILMFTLGKQYRVLRVNMYHFFILLLITFSIISSVWAYSPKLAVEKGITISQILVCTTVFYNYYSCDKDIQRLLKSIIWSSNIVTCYTVYFYGFKNIIKNLLNGTRLDNDFANVNAIGMSIAFSVILLMYWLIVIDKKVTFKSFFLIPNFLVILATGSRKAFIVTILGISIIIYMEIKKNRSINSFIKKIIFFAVVIVLFTKINSIPFFDLMVKRMEGLIAGISNSSNIDHSTYLRQEYIRVGLSEFIKKPFLGIGMGNSRIILMRYFGKDTYTHNNFVELLTNGGIVLFLLYYSIYIYIFTKLNKYKQGSDLYTNAILIMMLTLLISDFGAVNYYSKTTYFYFMIFFIQIKNMYSNIFGGNMNENKY